MMKQHRKISSLLNMALVCTVSLVVLYGCTKERIVRGEISPIQIVSNGNFQNIDSVVVDAAGRILVSDLNRVLVFNTEGSLVAEIGKQGTGEGEFANEVIGMAINSQDELYVVDQDGSRVLVFTLEGKFLRCFGGKGDEAGLFSEPQGITIDRLDLVYVTDKQRNDVQVFSRGGEFLYQIGKSGFPGTGLNEPESLAIHQDRLYVADEENQRIQIFDLRGRHLGHLPHSGVFALSPQFEASLDDVPHHTDVENKFHRFLDGDIEGIAFDGGGLLYVLNEDAGEIIVFHQEKMVGKFTSAKPILSGDGLAFDRIFQHLYVVDQGNARIQVFDVGAIHDLLGLP